MGVLRKVGKTLGQRLKGLVIWVTKELRFEVTDNPEIDSQGGGFRWNTETNNTSSWVLRDDVKGQDILVVDSLNDSVTVLPPYKFISSPNEGQVKLNTGNSLKPSYTWGGGIPAGTWQQIIYASPLGFSASPTTQWPQNILSPVDADIYDFVNNTFIENKILGQVNLWRVIFNYSGKAGNIAAGVEFRIENTLSGFLLDAVTTLPRTATSGTFVVNAITIGDSASIPAPLGSGQGYEFSLNSTDDMTIEVDSITRINYQKNPR